VFVPVWIDKHGEDKKSFMITIYQLGVPIGVFIGYTLTTIITKFYDVFQINIVDLGFIYSDDIFSTFYIVFSALKKRNSRNKFI